LPYAVVTISIPENSSFSSIICSIAAIHAFWFVALGVAERMATCASPPST
jgi:hypothetical protein